MSGKGFLWLIVLMAFNYSLGFLAGTSKLRDLQGFLIAVAFGWISYLIAARMIEKSRYK